LVQGGKKQLRGDRAAKKASSGKKKEERWVTLLPRKSLLGLRDWENTI